MIHIEPSLLAVVGCCAERIDSGTAQTQGDAIFYYYTYLVLDNPVRTEKNVHMSWEHLRRTAACTFSSKAARPLLWCGRRELHREL